MRRWSTGAALLLLGAIPTGCLEGELASRALVQSPRVLAIVADPPEAPFGSDIGLSALVVDGDGQGLWHGTDGVVFSWEACIRPDRVPGLSGLQYDPEVPSQGCGAVDALPMQTLDSGTGVIAGELTMAAQANLPMAARALGVPVDLLEQILSETGVPIVAQLTVRSDGAVLAVAFKRVLVSASSGALGTNPWAPRFRVGERWAEASETPFECALEGDDPLVLTRATDVVLDPEDVPLEPGPDTWIESYRVLDIRGQLTEVTERAYYSWFSTAGSFDQEVTRAPADEEIWTVPDEAGEYPLFVVVRDGHGGTSACRIDVQVR